MDEKRKDRRRGAAPVRGDTAPRNDVTPRNNVGVRNDIAPRKDLARGSRPPPQNRPSTSSLSILFVMGLVVVGAFVASGSLVPVDPNGPGGPPTLEPYYNPANYPIQHIVTPTGEVNNAKNNLQLQTFQVDNCGDNSVFMFLIDTSGSMAYYNKITNEKKALTYFTNNMGGLSAIGIDTFGGNQGDVTTAVPFGYYKDAKQHVGQIISGLTPFGGTPTRDAMQLAYNQLNQSIQEEDYPGYKYNLILMTDGVPEVGPPRTCEGPEVTDPNTAPLQRCFALDEDPIGNPIPGVQLVEDPAGTVPPPARQNIADEIRNIGVDIYVINVYSPQYASDEALFPRLNALLQEIASEPLSTHYYVSIDGTNLTQVLQQINSNICAANLNGTTQQ